MTALSHLLSPIRIKNLEIKNRVVIPPMGTNLANPDGTVSEALLAYLSRRASSGAGLVITEITSVHPEGVAGPTQVGAHDDRFIPGLRRMSAVIHQAGGKAALQLHHTGRESYYLLTQGRAMGPSALRSLVYGATCREMTLEDIHEVIVAFGQGARRAREAGFDAVEVHGAHGYLLTQFLSAISNQRTDEYGGPTLAHRSRFVADVLREVRRQVGDDFPVSLRVSSEEFIKNGYTVEDLVPVLPSLVEAGADVIHASIGTHGSPGGITSAPPEYDPGFNVWRAARIKQAVSVPVIGVGRFTRPSQADRAVAKGEADMIAFGRQLLADPDFLTKAVADREDDIRECLACNQGCIERLILEPGTSIRCAINPETGQELECPKEKAAAPRKVWVIGAGPAGLVAASEAARLGHTVRLFEKDKQPGGQIRFAAHGPHKQVYGRWIDWLGRQVREAGVSIETGTEVDGAMVDAGRPEAVILAVGGDKIVPEIPGVDLPLVTDAWRILDGSTVPGSRAVVVGGGLIGMETADFMAARGVKVTLVEMLKRSPVPKLAAHGYMLHKRLRDAGADMIFGAEVKRIENNRVVVEVDGREEAVEDVDQVVLAVGLKPREDLRQALENRGVPHTVVGDAKSVRRIIEAVEEGARAAWKV